MSARLTLHALLCSGREEDCKFLDTAYEAAKREILREAAEKIRTELPETVKESLGGGIWTITTVPTAKQAADLIDPDKEN